MLFQQALVIHEKVLGAEHPNTGITLNNLAFLYEERGRYDEAESLYKRSLAIKEKVLRADHPSTKITLRNLADLYKSQGKHGEAERFTSGRWQSTGGVESSR